MKENLDAEIRILQSLDHPHIVALFDCIWQPNFIYLVMEYCQLSDLAQFMKKRTTLSQFPETADIFRKYPLPPVGGLHEVVSRHFIKQIASALEYLHARNLVHRDIKPQNLLLNPSPVFMQKQRPEDVPLARSQHSLVPAVGVESLPMLKIADFGFARHLPKADLAETLCGSPLYMAPEILRYEKYDAKADLWSVGTVAYELMVGKPPFRAANHVELNRKIDLANDVIQFPAGLEISRDMKNTIRALLRRLPVERASFEEFLNCALVRGPIPGLVEEDVPRTANVSIPNAGISELSRRMQKQVIDNPAQARSPANKLPSRPSQEAIARRSSSSKQPSPPVSGMADEPRRPSADVIRRKTSLGGITRADVRPSSKEEPRRPVMVPSATAPNRHDLHYGRSTPSAAIVMDRRRSSRGTASPSTSAPKDTVNVDQTRRLSNKDALREARERTAQDLAFEREYVMIEKRAVEVNAFADEMAASPHIQNRGQSQQYGNMVRRVTTQGAPTSTTGAQPASPSNAMQMTTGRRPDALHARQASFERRYGPNTFSTTTMLSKALNMASARLWKAPGTSPPSFGKGVSPPTYNAFPTYPAPQSALTITDGKDAPALDEDMRVVKTIEDAASRSDVVYGFAEVKYRQLLPATPSQNDGLGIQQIGADQKSASASGDTEDQDLTQIAIVAVAEEARVLYIKALGTLAKCTDLAGWWWSNQRTDSGTSVSPTNTGNGKPNSAVAVRRMNLVVQWVRERFNECLEKSEIVGRRLVEAQKQLPPDHPGHPSNHPPVSESTSANNFGSSDQQIHLTSGVTAEKLMYDRAVEMSRAAAVNELVGEELEDCKRSYMTAIHLLEAVLEGDDEPLLPRMGGNKNRSNDEVINGMKSEDRKTVMTSKYILSGLGECILTNLIVIQGTKARLQVVRQKLAAQQQAQQAAGKRLSVGSAAPTKPLPRASPSTSPAIVGTPPR